MSDTKKPFKSEASNLHANHRQRMYDRFMQEMSMEDFAEHEILEILLYRNTPLANTSEIAHRLIDQFGSILRVLQAPPHETEKIKGMTKRSALDLSVLFHAMKVIPGRDMGEHPVLNSTEKAVAYVQNRLMFENYELAYIICLDNKFRVINVNRRTEYIPQSTALSVRTVVKKAMSQDASKVILVHNHPSGDITPSADDNVLTVNTAMALASVDIPLLDHIIIAGEGYYSYNKSDFIRKHLAGTDRYSALVGQLSDYSQSPMLNKLLNNKDI